ncbi:MAG: glycine zipper domain-containing protein [Pirellulales bacterium]
MIQSLKNLGQRGVGLRRSTCTAALSLLILLPLLCGCASNSRGQNGALLGGLGGAGLGAIAGNQVGHAGTGAAIGALAGAVTGGVIGDEIDEAEARNRAEIEARLGRPVVAGSVSIEDVIEMTQRGVHEDVIAQHVRAHGMTRPPATDDLIRLTQSHVSDRVIRAMQEQPAPRVVQEIRPVSPPPVIVERYYDPWPCWGPQYHHRPHRHGPGPGYSIGVSYGN